MTHSPNREYRPEMPLTPHGALTAAVARILRPLVRVLLRNGFSYSTFADIAKRVFVDVTADDFAIAGRKQSISRIALLTGLTRKEVARLRALPVISDEESEERHNRAARVIGGWLRDPEFLSGAEPDLLPLDGEQGSFTALVRRFSGDMPPRAVLDELLRVGAVARDEQDRIRLLARGYVPAGSDVDKLHLLGTDVAALAETIDHNLLADGHPARFQRKVLYDNLPEAAAAEFRELAGQRAMALLLELNEWLARHDRDAGANVEGEGRRRAGLGIYLIESDVTDEGSP